MPVGFDKKWTDKENVLKVYWFDKSKQPASDYASTISEIITKTKIAQYGILIDLLGAYQVLYTVNMIKCDDLSFSHEIRLRMKADELENVHVDG